MEIVDLIRRDKFATHMALRRKKRSIGPPAGG
jgi:hypothetical protein